MISKKNISLLILIVSIFIKAQSEFITIWQPNKSATVITDLPSSNSTQIYFPGIGVDYNVYWEEVGNTSHNGTLNNITTSVNSPLLIDFGSSIAINPQYILKVSNGSGHFNRIIFYNGNNYQGDVEKILTVSQWGNMQWESMNYAFAGCKNIDVTAVDTPNLTNVTELSHMFYNCFTLKGGSSFENWNISKVKSMKSMFENASLFNQNIGYWDTSNVIDMSAMFSNTTAFNQNLGNWNLKNLINATNMLNYSGISCGNYSATIVGWSGSSSTARNITLGAQNLFYGPILTSRGKLMYEKGWVFIGDTYSSDCRMLITQEIEETTKILIYPNPATDIIFIKNAEENSLLSIYDVNGRLIKNLKLIDVMQVSLKGFVKGTYYITIDHNMKSASKIIIK